MEVIFDHSKTLSVSNDVVMSGDNVEADVIFLTVNKDFIIY